MKIRKIFGKFSRVFFFIDFLKLVTFSIIIISMTTKVSIAPLINHIFIKYFIFSLPVSIEFAVYIHCNRHRIILVCVFPFAKFVCYGHHHVILVYFPSIVFFVIVSSSYHPYMFSIICVFLSVFLFIMVIIQIW
jgi:hypothetical protein